MIQCLTCGSVFNNDASYCNVCKINLTEHNSRLVYDNDELTQASHTASRSKRQLRMLTLGAMVLAPFGIFLFDLILFSSNIEKILAILLLESACLFCLMILLRGKATRTTTLNLAVGAVGTFFLLLSPIGLIPAAVFFWYLFKINTPGTLH